jgi:hypothetical protein
MSRTLPRVSDARLVLSLVLHRRPPRKARIRTWFPYPCSTQGGYRKLGPTIHLCHPTSTASTQLANAQHLATSLDAYWRLVPKSCHSPWIPCRPTNASRSTRRHASFRSPLQERRSILPRSLWSSTGILAQPSPISWIPW